MDNTLTHPHHVCKCRPDIVDHRDYILHMSAKNTKNISKIDLREQCPIIYNQGNLGSCVSNATAFCIQFNQIKHHLVHQFMPSRLFIYYNSRVIEQTIDTDSGCTIRDALSATNKQGVCPETIWPYDEDKYKVKPIEIAYKMGSDHTIKVYSRVQSSLDQMKQCLIEGYPFMFGLLVYQSFEEVDHTGMVKKPSTSDHLIGGHCMACIGFDDARGCFIVRNSWGNDWGDDGICYIPYDYVCDGNFAFDMWTIREVNDNLCDLNNIVSVLYGMGKKYVNVTTIFKKHFGSGHNKLCVSNQLFGDPCKGTVKELRILMSDGTYKIYREGSNISVFDLCDKSLVYKLGVIKNVTYGSKKCSIDVTTVVLNEFSKGRTKISVSNKTFGDPCVGVVKVLNLSYFTSNNVLTIKENSVLTLEKVIENFQ